jgi:hypothetical protein
MSELDDQRMKTASDLVEAIRPMLTFKDAAAVAAALAQLEATLWAGMHPALRAELMQKHRNCVRDLIPEIERDLFSKRERPKDWPQ